MLDLERIQRNGAGNVFRILLCFCNGRQLKSWIFLKKFPSKSGSHSIDFSLFVKFDRFFAGSVAYSQYIRSREFVAVDKKTRYGTMIPGSARIGRNQAGSLEEIIV